jgi:hypothetical protein
MNSCLQQQSLHGLLLSLCYDPLQVLYVQTAVNWEFSFRFHCTARRQGVTQILKNVCQNLYQSFVGDNQ